ncbi:cationic peroxidase 1-like [Dendrobium catenatum]|uniref:Peroxidase n=1 Tax=Dendrobium catenatum TaxID=906689 RepID=A0A2I0W8R6_9ASPA|nr:cationic peroxidase 1-like [Dendrobium catenatum]PKU72056.1 Cationic peroxidase 1 [Dendrobium catenatum]
MARSRKVLSSCLIQITAFSCLFFMAISQLSPDFYRDICPQALPTIRLVVYAAIFKEPRMGASLLRLHFHDCFVNGCDASVLLDDTQSFTGEKTAGPNNNSLRGFDVIDEIKAAVNLACFGNVVSCADILAVAARDSIVALGGSPYEVLLGRRDATTASQAAANNDLPAPFFDLPALVSNFDSHGLSLQDLVVLSGAHTLGFARCLIFRSRIYNETSTIDPAFARYLQAQCPPSNGGGDDILASFDDSPARFDADYFDALRQSRGVLHSDQQLFSGDGGEADSLVSYYSEKREAFWEDFGAAMVKMGSLSLLTGGDGEIRENCRYVNDAN